jgi:hypothetical protein
MRITYTSTIDDDVKKKWNIYNSGERQFDFYLIAYLNSPDGWSQQGYFFEPVERDGDIKISLSSTETIEKECPGIRGLSCAELGGRRVYLNATKWFHGAPKSQLVLEDYRQYMVSHEIGHILGHDHQTCRCSGCRAPIMMQQTLGLHECTPNTNVMYK